ncbi:hypothetical protein ACT8ZV_20845 [Nocardioides sp. MAHUQ-72]|uniref:hypothetical protein n=1 Tax=unclassified Nocardioides TaxID=2615069 RepID=UPI00360C7D4E
MKPDLPRVAGISGDYSFRAAKRKDLRRVNQMRRDRYHAEIKHDESMSRGQRWRKTADVWATVRVKRRLRPKGIYVAEHVDGKVAAAFKIKPSRSGELKGDGLIADENYRGSGKALITAVGYSLPPGTRLNIEAQTNRLDGIHQEWGARPTGKGKRLAWPNHA